MMIEACDATAGRGAGWGRAKFRFSYTEQWQFLSRTS
jgi:hypothetical protein